MSNRPVTLRDIAKKVGVHTSTVSRVLNPDAGAKVSREVALKVTRAAEELGYSLNPFARSLKTNQSFTIGVLIPDLTDPLFPPIMRGIEDTLSEAGYTAILANSDNDPDHERKGLETMRARKVDGLILATAQRKDRLVARCVADRIPLVLVNREVEDHSVPAVVNDDIGGMRMVTEHVISLGHRRIGHISGPQTLSTGMNRLNGYLAAMRAHGLPERHADMVEAAPLTDAAAQAAAEALLASDPDLTAIVTANDMLALGAYDALEARGLSCPDDVSVTGFNDIPFADKFKPPITTVRIQKFEMGAEAARLVLRMIKGENVGGLSMLLRPTLVVRGSTAPPRR
ncbi:MAG: LacI family transcriptional regulator [Alphaproteobacteria bacterium]|nr:MAG: LacI family transcriptional regulator [Alphaproteobacteria bacterium]